MESKIIWIYLNEHINYATGSGYIRGRWIESGCNGGTVDEVVESILEGRIPLNVHLDDVNDLVVYQITEMRNVPLRELKKRHEQRTARLNEIETERRERAELERLKKKYEGE